MILKWYHYLICAVLIILGLFCTMNLVELFSVESKEFGKAITIETKNDYVEISKFDLGSIVFDSEDYVNFELIETYAPTEFDGKNEDYLILFNGKPANNIDSKSGQISGDISMTFYDLEGNKVTTANFNVSIQYYVTQTVITISMVNENDSVSYLTHHANTSGVVISVVERSVV